MARLSFDVSGFATDHIGKVNGKDTGVLDAQINSINSSVSGTGESDSISAVFKGTVTAAGAKGEMQ